MENLVMFGAGAANFCSNTHDVLNIVGWILTIFKIAIPLIIIVLGLIDLGKAAVSNKPEEIKKIGTSLIYRIVGGILIFFVPAVVMMAIGFVGGFNDASKQVDWDVCYKCITAPWAKIEGKGANCAAVQGEYD